MTTASDRSTARPARRQRLSAEQRREQLIRATVSVVSRLGYQNASLAAIAAEAGMSKGLLWHYFADGDQLMEATARATLLRLRETVAADLDLSAPIPHVIRGAIHRAAALHQTHRAELRAMHEIVENLRCPDGTRRLGLADYEQTYQLQAALFQRGQDEGSLRTIDTRYLAVTYQGAVDAMLNYLDAYPETDAELYATTVADILLDGITPDKTSVPNLATSGSGDGFGRSTGAYDRSAAPTFDQGRRRLACQGERHGPRTDSTRSAAR